MPMGMLERLQLDPGSRTLGELFQERQWAVQEIERLRDVARQEKKERVKGDWTADTRRQVSHIQPDDSAHRNEGSSVIRLLRLADVRNIVGLSRSTIYMKIARGEFPVGIRVGARARRWRLADVVGWQERLVG
jgi:prophage regulatory protein